MYIYCLTTLFPIETRTRGETLLIVLEEVSDQNRNAGEVRNGEKRREKATEDEKGYAAE
jgi:hypothetical protein